MGTLTKYEVIEVDSVEITVDVSMLLKTDDVYFNATQIAKHFDKKADDFLRLSSTAEYVEAILKAGIPDIKTDNELIRISKGKYGGTWLHKELAFEFAGWCSATFRRNLHKWTEKRLTEEHQRRQQRLEAKTGFLPLTDAIKAAHSNPEFYHYSNECDMVNKIVTGMSAKKFKALHGVGSVRDGLTAAQLVQLDKLQRQNTSLIELGFDYEERKELLKRASSQSQLSMDL